MDERKLSGYSGTPLVNKLGIRKGMKIRVINAPPEYWDLLEVRPEAYNTTTQEDKDLDFVHCFAQNTKALEDSLPMLRRQLNQKGMIWISWPKKSSKVNTDLDGNVVRELGLKHGLVDIKVCSVNEVWSALKFVIPIKDRK